VSRSSFPAFSADLWAARLRRRNAKQLNVTARVVGEVVGHARAR
jgi:hypothetical protein